VHLKVLGKQEEAKPQINRWKEIIRIREEINEMETKRTIQRVDDIKCSLKR
jgi:hypothetical protein